MRTSFVHTCGAFCGVVLLKPAYHIVAFIAAAFDTRMQAIPGAIPAVVPGFEDRTSYINNHNVPPSCVTFTACQL